MAADRPDGGGRPNWWKRFGWLIGIWLASVLALALAAGAMRLFMSAIGLSVG